METDLVQLLLTSWSAGEATSTFSFYTFPFQPGFSLFPNFPGAGLNVRQAASRLQAPSSMGGYLWYADQTKRPLERCHDEL